MLHGARSIMNHPENLANTELTLLAQQALLRVLGNAELPVGVLTFRGYLLTIDRASEGYRATQSVPEEQRSHPVPLHELNLVDLAEMIGNGFRGQSLKDVMRPEPAESAMNEYRELVARIRAVDISSQDRVLEEHERAIADRPGLLGKIHNETAADGYAYYMLTQVRPGQARLSTPPVCDGYQANHIGSEAWMDTDSATRSLAADAQWSEMINQSQARKSRP